VTLLDEADDGRDLDHSHSHSNSHSHSHDHVHNHNHDIAATDEKTVAALLAYMLEHNTHHAQELHNLTHQLENLGRNEAALAAARALELYKQGNAELARAEELL
jgi:hypothetical protein